MATKLSKSPKKDVNLAAARTRPQSVESISNPGVTQLSLGVGTAGTIDRTLFPIRR
jgi:hypothetical protein